MDPIFKTCVSFFDCYISCFHPKTFLQRSIFICFSQYLNFNLQYATVFQAHEKEEQWKQTTTKVLGFVTNKSDYLFSCSEAINSQSCTPITLDPQLLYTSIGFKLVTLFSSRQELSKVSLLRKITQVCFSILEQVQIRYREFQEVIDNKTARSRQRKNFTNLQVNLICFSQMIQLSLLLVEIIFHGKDMEKVFSNTSVVGVLKK